ncbi:MAG TPA: hypothetical protein VNX28_14105 [Gemmataceae bacterium]|nr:hypothetical protein [Gemmataceae bacterium]
MMTIAFSCACGKAMKAKAAYAGRKVKCPQCGSVTTIPQASPDDDELTVTPPTLERAAPLPARLVEPTFTRTKEIAEQAPPPEAPPARPVTAIPERKPEPAEQTPVPAQVPLLAWVDQSLTQQPTPWLPGDEARFQRGVRAPREGMTTLEKGVLGLLVVAGAAAIGCYWSTLK